MHSHGGTAQQQRGRVPKKHAEQKKHRRVHIVGFHLWETLEKTDLIFSYIKQIHGCQGPGVGGID